MADAFLDWQGDFQVSATGGLMLADGPVLVRQRIERRLFTPVEGYVWHPTYGAGLPQRIGGLNSPAQIQSIVNSQIAQEASVAPSPSPVIAVTEDQNTPGLYVITISYTDAVTGDAVSFTISTS
jgi:hypothetical protein